MKNYRVLFGFDIEAESEADAAKRAAVELAGWEHEDCSNAYVDLAYYFDYFAITEREGE